MASISKGSETITIGILGLLTVTLWGCHGTGWQGKLDSQLPALGHRNWIVVADAAYPKQSADGIETVYTGAGQLEVLETVLEKLDAAPHVRPLVLLDAELASVTEADAPGVGAYRGALDKLLGDKEVARVPHEEIIARLDASSKLFTVLLLKTDMTIPYTSVFLELDCGYWGAEQEKRLRDMMAER